MTELLLESLLEKLSPRAAKVLRHSPSSSVRMGNTLSALTDSLLHPSCCQILQTSISLRCLDVPCLALFQVTQRHFHAKIILQKPLGNCWWSLYSQPVQPFTLAIFPPPVLVHRVETSHVLCKQLAWLSLQEDFCFRNSGCGRWLSLTK